MKLVELTEREIGAVRGSGFWAGASAVAAAIAISDAAFDFYRGFTENRR